VKFGPITASQAKDRYSSFLTAYEIDEISGFSEIYYIGRPGAKLRPGGGSHTALRFDDPLHHYRAQPGDHIAYRYEIQTVLGTGAFGQVLRCFDHKTRSSVALKIMVNTEQMHSQGRTEVALTQHLNDSPGFDHSHIVRAYDYFIFRRHICITFDVLGGDLFAYHRSINFRPIDGIQLKAIARGILTGLSFMHRRSVVHCDLKPENVLFVPGSRTDLRLIDFGSSCLVGHPTYEYIQSRFYRAPEVVLGIPYGTPMDLWSFGCVLAELATGRPLFDGQDEDDQIYNWMDVLGVPPDDVIAVSRRRQVYFDPDGLPLTPKKRRIPLPRSLAVATRIRDSLLLDLISQCLTWDQARRITANEALRHPWIAYHRVTEAETSCGEITRPCFPSSPTQNSWYKEL
jgi:dual specificity tyrosine-phosphorylation-regulated kinase 2/3/4